MDLQKQTKCQQTDLTMKLWPKKLDALVIANGDAPLWPELYRRQAQAQLTIATDGAGNHCLDHGITPDLIIGDLDSYQDRATFLGEVLPINRQDNTDLDKALSWLHERQHDRVEVWGATGKRSDHSLNNIGSLIAFHEHFEHLAFIDNHGILTCCPRHLKFTLPIGTPISLLTPTGPVTGITASGLAYPLRQDTLQLGRRDGACNHNIETDVEIHHDGGSLLIYVAYLPDNKP